MSLTAHDVRHLMICSHCKSLGDRRSMVTLDGGQWHGGCYIDKFGKAELLKLPHKEIRKLTLGDIGPTMMRAILERYNWATNKHNMQ